MAKKTQLLLVLALLLLFSLASAARRHPLAVADHSGVETHQAGDESKEGAPEGCEGFSDEECLMKKSPATQIDYIYTCGDSGNC